MGTVKEVNKRRKKSENVTVEFCAETHGITWGPFYGESEETYGIGKEWVVLKAAPIELSDNEGGERA